MKKKEILFEKKKNSNKQKHPDVIKIYHAQANRKIDLSAPISSVDWKPNHYD